MVDDYKISVEAPVERGSSGKTSGFIHRWLSEVCHSPRGSVIYCGVVEDDSDKPYHVLRWSVTADRLVVPSEADTDLSKDATAFLLECYKVLTEHQAGVIKALMESNKDLEERLENAYEVGDAIEIVTAGEGGIKATDFSDVDAAIASASEMANSAFEITSYFMATPGSKEFYAQEAEERRRLAEIGVNSIRVAQDTDLGDGSWLFSVSGWASADGLKKAREGSV